MGLFDSIASGVSNITSGVSNFASNLVGDFFSPNSNTQASTSTPKAREASAVNSGYTGVSSPSTTQTGNARSNNAVNSKYNTGTSGSTQNSAQSNSQSAAAEALILDITGSVDTDTSVTATEAGAFMPMSKQDSMAQAVAEYEATKNNPTPSVTGGGNSNIANTGTSGNMSNTAPQGNISQPTIVYVPTETTETTETESDSGLIETLKTMLLQNILTQSTAGGKSATDGYYYVQESEPETTEITETTTGTNISALLKQYAIPLTIGAAILGVALLSSGGKSNRRRR